MKPATLLLRWYRVHGRDLPWRKTQDPYRILVSEIMLQQTQVDRVRVYYKSWLKQFPSWKKLSLATNAEVITAWAGLGYNRRALMLRDVARTVNLNGLPQTEDEWLTIKGIGPYTASAISAFAQRKRTLPIDTNIRRVLGRYLLGIHFPQLADDEKIHGCTEEFLPRRGAYWDVPQAIFDLATSICTKSPDCARCPLKNECFASKNFLEKTVTIPKRSTKKPKERQYRNKPYPDRIYRGRILKTVRERVTIRSNQLGPLIDPMFDQHLDQEWIDDMVSRLIKDKLLKQHRKRLSL
ncbi:A/G-specific adenine glycosylase [Candidatus Uhrbacteria bacterium]|nr:A/G-specific adenine glycosylase [Candidatus Uhrbacteria bacterium]